MYKAFSNNIETPEIRQLEKLGYQTDISMKFILLIIVGILTFISMINTTYMRVLKQDIFWHLTF